MLFDTDMFIWVQRGHERALKWMERADSRFIALQSYLELLQSAQNKQQHRITKSFLKDFHFQTLPLTENIGHRAAVYIEEYALSSGLRAGDSLVAATAVEYGLPLASSNRKHFRAIQELDLRVFRP